MSDSGTVRCLRCDVPLEYTADRSLVDESPLALMRHWMKVIVLECPSCGHIELFNPGKANQQEQEDKSESEGDVDPRLFQLGILPGGANLPPEDPEVAKSYEADADFFRKDPDKDMPIG